MKFVLMLVAIAIAALSSNAMAQCPGGICPGTPRYSGGYNYRAPRYYNSYPRYAPVYRSPRPYYYAAPPVVVAPYGGFYYGSNNRSFGFGPGGVYYYAR